MDSAGVPMPRMDWDSLDLPDSWRRFRQHAELMFKGPLHEKSEEEHCSYLLLWVGEKGRDIYNTWTLTDENAKVLGTYYERFEAYVMPKKNHIFARYKFHEKVQAEGESFDNFVTELKLLVKDCGYANTDEMVRDRIVFAINSAKVKEKLLNYGPDLTLERAIDIARSHEIAQGQLKSMAGQHSTTHTQQVAHAVFKRGNKQKHVKTTTRAERDSIRPTTCGRCAQVHRDREKCPALGRQCKKCGKPNHFAKACKSQQTWKQKNVHAVNNDTEQAYESPQEFFIDTITKDHSNVINEQAFAEIEVGSELQKMKFKLDTGAQVNIIPENKIRDVIGVSQLNPATRRLSGYGGEPLSVRGTCRLQCKHKGTKAMQEFYVVDTQAPPILGLRACLEMDLIKLVLSVQTDTRQSDDLLSEFADVFEGIGEFPGECKIHIDPNAVPVVYPPRKIPFTLRSRLKEELERMERQGIIAKVTEPTDWVNALVVVEKPRTGALRICLDPRDLNKAIKRPHYPLPTLDDVISRLTGARYFSVLDARSGYWAIKLTEESSKLTTFNTVVGRYRFLRLPFGIISAQDEFQRKIDETYEGLPGVAAIVDDILVYGRTKDEHDKNLRAMLERTREKGVRLNPEKSTICVPEVCYFGHRLTHDGIKPDREKIKAIKEMEPPKNKSELETILGMINYLSRFAPRLAEINAPLRQMLKQGNEFTWDETHNVAFQQIKDLITREPGPVLAYYNPNEELRLQVDASKNGLGAVLLQQEKPIAYASKSLTETEQNYAQIEKELYAVLFGCKRFHQYVYGRAFIVESDHKPLESILKKPLSAAPQRLQRMCLQLQKYDFTLLHKPGKEIPVADTLSRKSVAYHDASLSEGMEAQVHTVISNLPVSDEKLAEIREATKQDPQLTALKRIIHTGWPETRRSCPPLVLEFWNHRDEISFADGIVLKGEKIIVPQSLRNNMLQKIHTGHMGVEKSKQRARDVLFWPGMGKQIEETVQNCSIWLTHRNSNQREPMIAHPIPKRPWQAVATDLFTWQSENYIIAVDYYSRFFELEKLHSTSAAAVIRKLKGMFARHGVPEKIVSDNGPQYSSQEFSAFAKQWDFVHTTTSPYYAQSNGLAEKTVQTAKRILTKAREEGKDPYLSILEHRNAPVDGFKSPAQLLMSRRLRSILPITGKLLQPQTCKPSAVQRKREQCQIKQKSYYDRSAKSLITLEHGARIYAQQNNGQWKPAVVSSALEDGRSYIIRNTDGQEYRRNRKHLMDVKGQNVAVSAQLVSDDNSSSQENTASNHTMDSKAITPTPTDHCVITRSGRIVKQRQILDL